jgi:hypothetical protein
MSIILQQILLLLVIVILQRSFLDILWPGLDAPSLIIATIVALVFILGFSRALGWVIALVFFYELLGSGTVQAVFPVAAVAIAYAASFLSRRLLIERHAESSLALGLVSASAVLAHLLSLVLFRDSTLVPIVVIGNMLLASFLFPIVFTVLRIREERIRFGLMSEFRGMRT